MNFKANLLKKSLIVLVLLLVGTTAFAANGDTLNIGGVVPLVLTLTVTPDAAADNLTLVAGVTTATTANLAQISIDTNNSAGYELWIFSANNGTMNNADGNTIGYTLTYAGNSGATAQGTTTAGNKFGENTSATAESNQLLTINYSQEPDYPAGYYSDQLTVVLRAK